MAHLQHAKQLRFSSSLGVKCFVCTLRNSFLLLWCRSSGSCLQFLSVNVRHSCFTRLCFHNQKQGSESDDAVRRTAMTGETHRKLVKLAEKLQRLNRFARLRKFHGDWLKWDNCINGSITTSWRGCLVEYDVQL